MFQVKPLKMVNENRKKKNLPDFKLFRDFSDFLSKFWIWGPIRHRIYFAPFAPHSIRWYKIILERIFFIWFSFLLSQSKTTFSDSRLLGQGRQEYPVEFFSSWVPQLSTTTWNVPIFFLLKNHSTLAHSWPKTTREKHENKL